MRKIIKSIHAEEDTTTKQKTIRSHNNKSGEDCTHQTKINRQRKREGCDKVSRRSNCVEIFRKSGAVVARRKERARQFCEVGCPKVKLEQSLEGEASCGKVCEEGLPKVKLQQEGEESWEGSAKKVAEGQMREENSWRAFG